MSRPQLTVASAPGKLVLMGEYAVLRGHEAVVAAVDVRAVAQVRSGAALEVTWDAGGLLRSCVDELLALGGAALGRLAVDTSAFRDDGDNKLGLGSSAAACVATLRALAAAGALSLDRDELHMAAQRAHRRFQRGRGSGIDVAASTFGGVVRFRRPRDAEDVVASPAPPLPASLVVVPVWTGRSQDTRDFITAALACSDIDALLRPLADAATDLIDACHADDGRSVLAAVDLARSAMLRLGERAGIEIVSAAHAAVAALAREHGGAAKPSGAGGGDVALAFVPVERAATLRVACVAAGLPPLAFAVGGGVRGAALDQPSPPGPHD